MEYVTRNVWLEEMKEIARSEGEKKLSKLIQQLLSLGRTDDVAKAVSDEDARKAFYREFGMNGL